MEEAGILWVRSRGVRADVACAATGEPFNLAGLYWDGGRAFVLLDVVSRRPWTPGAHGARGAERSVERALIGNPDVLKVAAWPFFRPDPRAVAALVARLWQSLPPASDRDLVDFVHRPQSVRTLLPPLEDLEVGDLPWPGVVLVERAATEPSGAASDTTTLSVLARALSAGELGLVSLDARKATCLWCTGVRELVGRLETEGRLDATSALGLWGASGELCLVPRDLKQDWAALMAHVQKNVVAGEPLLFPWEVLEKVSSNLFGVAVETPPGGTYGAAVVVGSDESRPLEGLTTVRHLPLFHASLEGLDPQQLEELAQHLGHPAARADPRTSDLRARVHAAQAKNDPANL